LIKRRTTIPYIKSGDGRREALQKGDIAQTAGELNYEIFYYIKQHLAFGRTEYYHVKEFVGNFLGDKPNYQKYNDMTGCLILCWKEIKRRLGRDIEGLLEIAGSYADEIAKYEDVKIQENGDVE
jgi:hypothetical protein